MYLLEAGSNLASPWSQNRDEFDVELSVREEVEGEEEILGDEGQHEGGGGQDLGDEQQEHNQRQQNADPEGHLTQPHLQQLSHSRPVSDVLRCLKAFTSPI